MEDAVKQRIRDVLHDKNITLSGFAGSDGSLQKKLSRQINLGGALTFETISAILTRYRDVSAEWLMRGNGTMYSTEEVCTDEDMRKEISDIRTKLEQHQELLNKLVTRVL